jgi:hypothetical protein
MSVITRKRARGAHLRQFRDEVDDERGDVDREYPRVVVRVVRRDEEAAAGSATRAVCELRAHSIMGTEMSHFFAGVYCAPSSICSQSVRLSYAPPCISLWNGTPVAQWKMR